MSAALPPPTYQGSSVIWMPFEVTLIVTRYPLMESPFDAVYNRSIGE